jgi:hypothetical protein
MSMCQATNGDYGFRVKRNAPRYIWGALTAVSSLFALIPVALWLLYALFWYGARCADPCAISDSPSWLSQLVVACAGVTAYAAAVAAYVLGRSLVAKRAFAATLTLFALWLVVFPLS